MCAQELLCITLTVVRIGNHNLHTICALLAQLDRLLQIIHNPRCVSNSLYPSPTNNPKNAVILATASPSILRNHTKTYRLERVMLGGEKRRSGFGESCLTRYFSRWCFKVRYAWFVKFLGRRDTVISEQGVSCCATWRLAGTWAV